MNRLSKIGSQMMCSYAIGSQMSSQLNALTLRCGEFLADVSAGTFAGYANWVAHMERQG